MDFLKVKEVSTKCSKCYLNKTANIKIKNSIIEKKGNGDILFILEYPEREEIFVAFKNFLRKKQITDYQIVLGISCQPHDFKIKNPVSKIYKNCNIDYSDIDCKVIMPIGRGIFNITKNNDINHVREYGEILFNQTYFYTPLKWSQKTGKKIRCYPIPAIYDWYNKDGYEKTVANFQIKEVLNFLENYEVEKCPEFTINKVEDTSKFFIDNYNKPEVAWDTETNSLDHFIDDFKTTCLTMSFDGKDGYYLPFEKINKRQLSSFLKNRKTYLANAKYDLKVLELEGIKDLEVSSDIILFHHMLNTLRLQNSLKSLSWLIGFGGYEEDLDDYKEINRIDDYSKIPEKVLIPYSVIDAIVTFRVEKLAQELIKKQPNIYKPYLDVLKSLPVFQEMEMEGMLIDIDYLNKTTKMLKEKISVLDTKIYNYFGRDFDINSVQQLAVKLDEFEFEDLGRNKTTYKKGMEEINHLKVGDLELKHWSKKYPICKEILEHRSTTKLINTFLGETKPKIEEDSFDFFVENDLSKKKKDVEEGIVKSIKSDGKVHTLISPGMADSIRSKSGNRKIKAVNIQNFPKQGKEGKLFRPVFIVPEGYDYFMEFDFSGFQMRIATIESQDPVLKDIFLNKGGDAHSVTATNIFCRDMNIEDFIKQKDVNPFKTYRQRAKTINFAFLFGSGAWQIVPDIEQDWLLEDIENYISDNNLEIKEVNNQENIFYTVACDIRYKFFQTYVVLHSWIEKCHIIGEKQGYTDSIQGVRRHIPQLKFKSDIYTDGKLVANLKNIATNSKIQSVEAIIMYQGLRKFYDQRNKYRLKSKFVNMVHDSVGLIVPKNEIEIIYEIGIKSMENYDYEIPFTVDCQIGKIWGFGEEIKNKSSLLKFME